MELIRLYTPKVIASPQSKLHTPDGKGGKPTMMVGPTFRTRGEARETLGKMAEHAGKRFIQATIEDQIYVTQEQWDVLDMSQREAYERAGEANGAGD